MAGDMEGEVVGVSAGISNFLEVLVHLFGCFRVGQDFVLFAAQWVVRILFKICCAIGKRIRDAVSVFCRGEDPFATVYSGTDFRTLELL